MTQSLACDYSFARPSPAAIAAAGYTAVLRYLSGVPHSGKDITPDEVTALHAAGLGIGLIWETTAHRSLDGADAGHLDGVLAAQQAIQLGSPANSPLLVNIGDFAATPDELIAIEDYYHAFVAQVTRWRFGGYGTAYIINHLVAGGYSGLWWQNAIDDQGESGSVVSPNASLYQRVTPTLSIPGAAPGSWDEDVMLNPIEWWLNVSTDPGPWIAGTTQLLWSPDGVLHLAGLRGDKAYWIADMQADGQAVNLRRVTFPLTFQPVPA